MAMDRRVDPMFHGIRQDLLFSPNIESNRYRIEHVDRENGLFFLGKQNSLDFYELRRKEIVSRNYV